MDLYFKKKISLYLKKSIEVYEEMEKEVIFKKLLELEKRIYILEKKENLKEQIFINE
mgnify:CR=1 FL=1